MTRVLPAIDIRDGRCVRLHQGSYDEETVYFDDPVEIAKVWQAQNAHLLHVVDLDAARGDGKQNREVIEEMCTTLDIPVQVGGGIRSLEEIEEALDVGVHRVVLGTAAVRSPDLVETAVERFSSRRIVVSIDARDGQVRVEGWTEGSGLDAGTFAQRMEARGVRRFVYTDIQRDGTMKGPNIEAYRTLGRQLTNAKITASGGVGDYEDLLNVQTLRPYGVDSVIVGTALYENRFPCQQFWTWHDPDEWSLEAQTTTHPDPNAAPAMDE